MFTIVSTRFDDNTWQQNVNFRLKYNYDGCIYGVPQTMSPKIPIDSIVFVIEMNNTINQIQGIGLLKNNLREDKYYKVYDTGDYNRYIYKSQYRIDRTHLIIINQKLVELLDYILFKGKTHLKRGYGFTTVPDKLLNHEKCQDFDIKNEIKSLFIRTFNTK
jgi:hypothetical protein